MATENLIIETLSSAVRFSTPLLLAGTGELLAERSGVVNIGIEGMMLMGAFAGAMTGALLQTQGWPIPAWLGWSSAIGIGAIAGALLAFWVVVIKADQIVTGLGFNLLGLGLTGSLFTWIGSQPREQALRLGGVGFAPTFSADAGPGSWPVIGPILLQQTPPFFLAMLLLVLVHLWLMRTRTGLYLRACGENPAAVDTAGHSVGWIRFGACTFAGACAGAAGGFLSLAATQSYADRMSDGMGFVALALVIFGKWRVGWVTAAALFFGLLAALKNTLQASQGQLKAIFGDFNIDTVYPLFSMLPYLFTLLALAGLMGRSRPPAALGEVYKRE